MFCYRFDKSVVPPADIGVHYRVVPRNLPDVVIPSDEPQHIGVCASGSRRRAPSHGPTLSVSGSVAPFRCFCYCRYSVWRGYFLEVSRKSFTLTQFHENPFNHSRIDAKRWKDGERHGEDMCVFSRHQQTLARERYDIWLPTGREPGSTF
jgi:hypothetical protein